MTRSVLWLALWLGTQAAAAQPAGAPAVRPIEDVLRDADGDGQPDALGDAVTVAGRALAPGGALGPVGPWTAVRGAARSLAVGHSPGLPAVAAGDSVVVRGTLASFAGMVYLDDPAVRRIDAPARAVAPASWPSAAPEAAEGDLVTLDAVVVAESRVEAGRALSLTLADHTPVVAFLYADGAADAAATDYEPGDRLRVTGIAGQFDRVAPYTDSYQVYPRSGADLARAGIPARLYRWGALGALGLFLGASAWAATLRRQVRRRVEQLRHTEDRHRRLVELASDGVIVHDLDGGHAELNRAARDAIGLAEGAAPPPLRDVLTEATRPVARAHFERLAASGTARSDFQILGPDGQARLYEFESQLVELGGETRVLSLARDVDARRDFERGLVAARAEAEAARADAEAARAEAEGARAEAEETARVKSAFLASMSHEIRTPLTAVIGFAEVLRDDVPDDALDLVEAIESGGRRLLSTLNSVLDLAQIDAGGEVLRPAALDLPAHLAAGARLLRPGAEAKGLALHLDAPPALAATLDAGALDRVLANLVGNAVKFTDAGAVTVGLRRDGDAAVLTVADTGIGIDAAFLPELFSEFRQESEGHARSHEGSGLGLAITRRLVELMGGTIAVASEKGTGTTFTVRLPLHADGSGTPDGAVFVARPATAVPATA